jgi:hypothetical protein
MVGSQAQMQAENRIFRLIASEVIKKANGTMTCCTIQGFVARIRSVLFYFTLFLYQLCVEFTSESFSYLSPLSFFAAAPTFQFSSIQGLIF